MSEIAEPKVDDRPSLYIRDEYARQLPSDIDIGDTMNFAVKAEVTGISKNKYEEDEEEHISYDFKINTMQTDGVDEKDAMIQRATLGVTSQETLKKLFGNGSAIVITFKKD